MDISKKILIVDDEPLSIANTIDYLNDGGYFTHFVASGKKAWEVLNENPQTYDAVIIDQAMPEVDGATLLGMIKGSSHLNQIPVIMETDNEDEGAYFSALECGAYDYIYKPAPKDLLLYLIDGAVNNTHKNKHSQKWVEETSGIS